MTEHFLRRDGYDVSRIVGHDKPFRGKITGTYVPHEGDRYIGIHETGVTMSTSRVVRIDRVITAPGFVIYTIETLNSVYTVIYDRH